MVAKMEKKRKIVQYRERLDKTLASPDLTNKQMLKEIVKSQLLRSSEQEIEEYKDNLIEAKTAEVSKILDLLRSASVEDSGGSSTSRTDWKLKQDNEEYRVMYREGPEGTPFHTLLVEGYVDGPIDVCLCLSWEAPLYKKWWPQFVIPAFKVTVCDCLQKVQIGEQISLVRMKLSWPLSTREAVVHYYLFEYYQDDLVVVLLHTVPESKGITETIDGFNSNVIPESKDVVRIDLVGGFVLQKVTPERSYFRTIANMDIKLDFVPPSLINFISRQLIGSGFRLYQKAVASMMNLHDEEFRKALEDPFYVRIREALYNINESKAMNRVEHSQVASVLSDNDHVQSKQDGAKEVSSDDTSNKQANNFNAEIAEVGREEIIEANSVEITEVAIEEIIEANSEEIAEADNEEIAPIKEDDKKVHKTAIEEADTRSILKGKRNIYISSEVRQALGTLEKAISMVREYGFHPFKSSTSFANEESRRTEKGGTVDSHSAKPDQLCSKTEVSVEVSNSHVVEETSQEEPGTNSDIPILRHPERNPSLKEVNYNKVVPASPEQNLSRPIDSSYTVKDIPSNDMKKSRMQKKHRYCCFLH